MQAGIQVFARTGFPFPRNDGKMAFRTFYETIIFDDLAKSRQDDGFVKSSPATGGTRRAKTEE
jgi:hypothetical protein